MTSTANALLEQLNELATRKGSPLKILIVDDEERVRETFRDICNLSGHFEVDLAQSGQAAIERVAREQYDLVTLDLIMPDISGLEAIERIKQQNPRLPVIIITGNATDKVIKEAGVKGASKVLYKPLEATDLLQSLVDTLRRQAESG